MPKKFLSFELYIPYSFKGGFVRVCDLSLLAKAKQTKKKKHCRRERGVVIHILHHQIDFLEQTLSFIHHRQNITE